MKMPARASDPTKSPYRRIANSISEALKQWRQNTIHPSEVAKVIVQAVMADIPDFRYVVGKGVAMILETRRSMSDREFQDRIRQQFNLQNIS